jgi:hypothetical protein
MSADLMSVWEAVQRAGISLGQAISAGAARRDFNLVAVGGPLAQSGVPHCRIAGVSMLNGGAIMAGSPIPGTGRW